MVETDELVYNRYLTSHNENDIRILLERHKDSLVLFLMGFVHDIDDAEELMLDAFAEVAASRKFSGKSSFKTWLFSIGKNKALMSLRKKRFIFVSEDELPESASEDRPETDILKNERDRQLYKALDGLNKEYRQILLLLFFEEMTPEEAGRVMGKNRKQIYNLAERGKKALKEELEKMGYENVNY